LFGIDLKEKEKDEKESQKQEVQFNMRFQVHFNDLIGSIIDFKVFLDSGSMVLSLIYAYDQPQ